MPPRPGSEGGGNRVVQTPSGAPHAGYGGFTNFADPTVRRYNVAVARAAAAAGIDDVLYDYVRRPDGPIESMRFPNLRGSPEQSIATFLGEARRALKPHGTFLGASVFGVAATRPEEVAQQISSMAQKRRLHLADALPIPLGPGEYRVSNPNAEPYAIVRRSLRDFQRQASGTGARIVPVVPGLLARCHVRASLRSERRSRLRRTPGSASGCSGSARHVHDGCSPETPRLDPIPTKRTDAKAVVTAPEPTGKAAAVRANELGAAGADVSPDPGGRRR